MFWTIFASLTQVVEYEDFLRHNCDDSILHDVRSLKYNFKLLVHAS